MREMKPAVNNELEDAPLLPRWNAEEKGIWLDLLEQYSAALLPQDEDGQLLLVPEKKAALAENAVKLGARLADLALEEYQLRLYAQSESEYLRASDDGGYDEFRSWLHRRARPRRENSRRKR